MLKFQVIVENYIRRARVFIDTEHAKVESGDIRFPLETGIIGESDILGTMTDLCRGACAARGSDDEITLFKGVGIAEPQCSHPGAGNGWHNLSELGRLIYRIAFRQ